MSDAGFKRTLVEVDLPCAGDYDLMHAITGFIVVQGVEVKHQRCTVALETILYLFPALYVVKLVLPKPPCPTFWAQMLQIYWFLVRINLLHEPQPSLSAHIKLERILPGWVRHSVCQTNKQTASFKQNLSQAAMTSHEFKSLLNPWSHGEVIKRSAAENERGIKDEKH